MNQNKTAKYFKYAIGEIILVVIGILFAVQINSWFNAIETKRSNKVYLTKIIEELKLNKDRLNLLAFNDDEAGERTSIETAVENCDSLIKLAALGLKASDLDYVLNVSLISGFNRLNLYDATYTELLNTGKLYTFGNDSIALAIKDYYKRYQRETEYVNQWNDHALSGIYMYEPFITQLRMDHTLNPNSFSLSNYPWYFEPKLEIYKTMQLGLRRLRHGQNHQLDKCKALIEDSDVLITVLEKELKEIYN